VSEGRILAASGLWASLNALALQLRQPVAVTVGPNTSTFLPCLVDARNPGAGDVTFLTESYPMDTVRTMSRRTVGRGI